jgi:hypothetical protein
MTDNSVRGRSNRTKGNTWMRQCVTALRANGWPHTEIIPSNGRGDLTGCGDLNVECKDEQAWNNLAAHLEQSRADADRKELPTFIVWRKRRGVSDPMAGYVVMTASQFWADRKELERLEADVLAYQRLRAELAEGMAARGTFTLVDASRDQLAKIRAEGLIP